MRSHRQVSTLVAIAIASLGFSVSADAPRKKVLIEFGWDEPDTAFLRKHISEMEQTPFDGCVFHAVAHKGDGTRDDLAWHAWGRRAYNEAELAQAIDDLKVTQFKRFSHNFLRVNTTPADLDWFDDHAAVLANLRLAARIARAGRCRGILLDTEEYQGKLFAYRSQRESGTKSWAAYSSRARSIGRDAMSVLQEEYPGLTILLTFGPSLVRSKTGGGKAPIEDAEYGLLVPFVEGMKEAVLGPTPLIDGHEPSYGYRDTGAFEKALRNIREAAPTLEAGFGLWLDYDHLKHGWNADDPAKNYFAPEGFETSLRAALERADEIVWIYTENPRWWTEQGGSVKLPAAYVEAIRRVRKDVGAD